MGKIGQIECSMSVAPCFRLRNYHRPSNSWVVHFQVVNLFRRSLFWNIFWGIYKGSEILISTEEISAILNSNLITIVTNENCTDSSTRSTAFEASLIFILKRKSQLDILILDSISYHDVILKSITAPKSGISKLQSESFGFCETASLHYWICFKLN